MFILRIIGTYLPRANEKEGIFMKCSKCGAENQRGKFCQECGELLEEQTEEGKNERENERENEQTEEGKEEPKKGKRKNEKAAKNHKEDNKEKAAGKEADEDIPRSKEEEQEEYDVKEALLNLEKYEQGTITDPKDKPKDKKKSFLYPQNPMLWSFLWLLLFGAILGALSAIFFGTDLEGKETVFGIIFAIFAAVVLGIDFIYYFPAALQLDKLLKGKGVRLEYRLKNYELIEIAEKAKKRNRGFYLAIGLFGLAFSIYYIYILATTVQQTTLMWISLIFSACVFIICAALFFVMPKFNYGKTMENGSRVIIGNKSVYYGGTYYHWRKVQPDATFGKVNTKKHELEITFTQDFKNGKSQKQRVELYAPDTSLREITRLLEEYEKSNKKYREKKEETSEVNGKPVS